MLPADKAGADVGDEVCGKGGCGGDEVYEGVFEVGAGGEDDGGGGLRASLFGGREYGE